MILTIGICSLAGREAFLERLLAVLNPQIGGVDNVEVAIDVDAGDVSIGQKRQRMLERARGEWICWVDDDDLVSPDYVQSILHALESNPDCVGFIVDRWHDGQHDCQAIHSLRNENYQTIRVPSKIMHRPPTHLNPIRASIARKVGFLPMNHGEDIEYSRGVRPLLTTENFIDRPLYVYLFRHCTRGVEQTHERKTGTN